MLCIPLTGLFWLQGVEDGQTVRMPVGKKEIFITFRVSIFITSPSHMSALFVMLRCPV